MVGAVLGVTCDSFLEEAGPHCVEVGFTWIELERRESVGFGAVYSHAAFAVMEHAIVAIEMFL
jgi:hypothetical protein